MNRAFAIAAHPDDIEFLMAGTMMQLKACGWELHYMNVANGCCGTTEMDRESIIATRKRESQQAAEKLGATYHPSLCDDLSIFYEPHTLARISSVIREVAPTIVLTHAPIDYMEDHTNTCRLVTTAAFARGMPNFPVEPPHAPVEQPVALYHAQPYTNQTPLREQVVPDWFVDTTELIDRKRELLSCHASQKNWLDESQGQDSYLDTILELDGELGRWSGRFRYCEGWRQHLPVGFGPDDWNPLLESLKDVMAPRAQNV